MFTSISKYLLAFISFFMLTESMYSAEDYGLGEDSAEDCEHGDAVVIKKGSDSLPNIQINKVTLAK